MKKLAFLFILLAALTIHCSKDSSVVKTFDIGEYKLYLLSDLISKGDKNLLIDASDEMLKRYVPDGSYPTAMNCFAVRMPNKVILIDTGLGTNLLKNLARVQIDPKEVTAVLITHMHFDHISGLLKDGEVVFPNADIYISHLEHKFWTSEKEMEKAGEAMRGGFQIAANVVKVYGPKLHLFTPNELGAIKNSLFEGITPIAAYGHTPGHTMYMIESKNEKLIVWGDLVHAMSIQMPNPEVALKYDMDYKQAVAVRAKVLKYISDNKISVAGIHIVPPGAGTIEAAVTGGYSFTPFK